jgi:acetoin utilization protein AcuC
MARIGLGLIMPPSFIGSEIYRLPVFKPPHPLAVPRAMLVRDLCNAMGWLVDEQYIDSPMATAAELGRFHDRGYISALIRAEAEQDLPEALRQLYRIGADANIIHPAVFRRPAISAGGAMLAARLTAGGGVVQAPGVGSHHGQPARASGFCFANDVVLGLMQWQALGVRRIVYLDLDAHHGDGVEAAFADDPDVLTISVHEAGRWPRSGTTSSPGQGIWNFPVPPRFNDSELDYLMETAILPLIRGHAPEALWLLPGADALTGDPMAKLALSNSGLWEVVARLRKLAPRLVVCGGGGYNPYLLARCWSGIWAILNDLPIPDTLPPAAAAVLGGVEYFRAAGRNPPAHWLNSLRDAANTGVVRDEVKRLGEQELADR